MGSSIKNFISTSLIAAIFPMLCCFVLAILSAVAGLGFISGSFAWVHPAQPYLNIFSVTTLGVAHYNYFKISMEQCRGKSCQNRRTQRIVNKLILWSFTILVAVLLMTNYWYEF